MVDKKRKRRGRSASDQKNAPDKRESGEPGGGQGRRDEVGTSGVYPPTAENIPPDAEIRMAGSWGGGDYEESGGSELTYREGRVLGGLSAGPDGEPTIDTHEHGGSAPGARGDAARAESGDDADDSATLDPAELRLRGLPKGSDDSSAAQGERSGESAREEPPAS
jgi:hypothetical protein